MAETPLVVGDKEVEKMFQKLAGQLQKKAIRKATRSNAKIVLAEAKDRVPEETGLLEQSLKVRAMKRSRVKQGHQVIAGGGDVGEGNEPYYSAFVEYGTSSSVGDPYLRPALYGNRTRIIQNTAMEIKKYISTLSFGQRHGLFS